MMEIDCLFFIDDMKTLFIAKYWECGTPKRSHEETSYMYLLDFMDKCEGNSYFKSHAHDALLCVLCIYSGRDRSTCRCTWKKELLKLEDLLSFCTGSDRIPPGGFPSPPIIYFSHDESNKLTTASTCDSSIILPTCYHNNQEMFEEMLVLSLKGYDGFGRLWLTQQNIVHFN